MLRPSRAGNIERWILHSYSPQYVQHTALSWTGTGLRGMVVGFVICDQFKTEIENFLYVGLTYYYSMQVKYNLLYIYV